MTNFALPETTSGNPPSFIDVSGCKAWLGTLPLANPVQSQALLLRQLNLLNRYAIGGLDRLRLMELLRGPVTVTQEGSVRRYAGKPLPLSPAEDAAYESTQALWQALATGYLHCLAAVQAGTAGADNTRAQVALLAQRALAAMGMAQIDAYWGGRMPPTVFWQLLYRIYRSAEEAGAAQLAVEDRVRHSGHGTSVAGALTEAVLIHSATPYELNPRQFGWLARWARYWSDKVAILAQAPREPKAVPLHVDIAGDRPPGILPKDSAGMRWLEVSDLRSSLKKRLSKLAAGATPAELGLGDDCPAPAAEALLQYAYQRWCKGGAPRRQDLRAAKGLCRVVGGINSIYQQLSGRSFEQPGRQDGLSRRQSEEIATFGRIAMHHLEERARQEEPVIEEWKMLEEWRMPEQSATGIRIQRALNEPAGRFIGGQLVAVRLEDAAQFLLGCMQWLRIDAEQSLLATVQIFAGFPEPVVVRASGLLAANDKHRPGFLLPAVDVLKLPTRLIAPTGLFRPNLVVDVAGVPPRQLRLTQLIERTGDFECAAYQAVP